VGGEPAKGSAPTVLTEIVDQPLGQVDEIEGTPPWAVDIYGQHVAQAVADPARRRIAGTILSVTAQTSGMTSGACVLFFERNHMVVVIGTVRNPLIIPYAETASLQIGGRGDVVTKPCSRR
jgi:hypothetical protein